MTIIFHMVCRSDINFSNHDIRLFFFSSLYLVYGHFIEYDHVLWEEMNSLQRAIAWRKDISASRKKGHLTYSKKRVLMPCAKSEGPDRHPRSPIRAFAFRKKTTVICHMGSIVQSIVSLKGKTTLGKI